MILTSGLAAASIAAQRSALGEAIKSRGTRYTEAVRDCNQCGKCCTNYAGGGGLSATAEEIDYWETYRPDIARFVRDGNIWADPENGAIFERCPWLELAPGSAKYTCAIYDDRPGDCRYYPVDIEQMVRDDCEMLQPGDLRDLRSAQRKLDLLMSDSRPPVIK